MSESKRQSCKCVNCGKVVEMDMGFAESRIPSPEESVDSWAARHAQVTPVDEQCIAEERPVKQEPIPEPILGAEVTYTLGDCPECGGTQWTRFGDITVDLPPINDPPQPEKKVEESVPVDPVNEPQAPVTIGQHEEPSTTGRIIGEVNVDLPPIEVTPAPEQPVKEQYKCVGCGLIEEFEAKLAELPTCSLCGMLDWEKVNA